MKLDQGAQDPLAYPDPAKHTGTVLCADCRTRSRAMSCTPGRMTDQSNPRPMSPFGPPDVIFRKNTNRFRRPVRFLPGGRSHDPRPFPLSGLISLPYLRIRTGGPVDQISLKSSFLCTDCTKPLQNSSLSRVIYTIYTNL